MAARARQAFPAGKGNLNENARSRLVKVHATPLRRQKIRAAKLALDVGLSRLGLLVVPAAEVAGRPARGRGVAFERRVTAAGPALRGVWGELLPSEASKAPGGRMASAAPSRKLQ